MAIDKETLLKYFKSLDLATLEKLEKYSKLLIIPEEDLLVNATMSQMVDKAHTLADSLFPEWTDRSKSDFGEFLVELFALFSEKDFWYINAFANEGILRKMHSYSNAFSKASTLGYYPTICKGATSTFNISFEKGSEIDYERGDLIVTVNGVDFTNDDRFTIEESSSDKNVILTLREGSQMSEDVVYNGYSIFIRKKNIDLDSLIVIVDNITYSRVRNFGSSSEGSTHYMVLPEEDGSCSIYFGSNGFGVQPSIGSLIRVEYRICNGIKGNMPINGVESFDGLTERKPLSATMLTEATGGYDAETLTSIKEKAPLFFYNKRAAINETIAQDMLNSFSFVCKSKVEVIGREVVYRVIPNSGYLEPTNAERKILQEEFEPCIMLGFTGKNASNLYKNLIKTINPFADKLIIDVIALAGYDLVVIESSLRAIMEDVTSPLIGADYGGTFSKTNMDILIRSKVPGVQNVTFKSLIGVTEQIISDVTLGETEIFRKINQDDLIVRINVV